MDLPGIDRMPRHPSCLNVMALVRREKRNNIELLICT